MHFSHIGLKSPRTTAQSIDNDVDLSDGPTSPLYSHPNAKMPRMRRESQFQAVAHTLDKAIAGHAIRSWSAYLALALAIHLSLYLGITKQNLRRELYQANTSSAKFELFYATFTALVVPSMCRFFLKVLAGSVAGLLLGEHAYSVPSACLLLAVNFRMDPDINQNMLLFKDTEKGVRGVLLIRLVGDYIVHLTVPFVALSLLVQKNGDTCWMRFDWGWLLLVILWPTIWSLLALAYMTKYWTSQQCVRSGFVPKTPTILEAATELTLVVQDAHGKSASKWRHGHRVSQDQEQYGSFLGLVRENECVSLAEMLLGMEGEAPTHPHGAVRHF